MITDKEQIISIIKNRILTEHSKYAHMEHMDWIEIAARKIYSTLKQDTDLIDHEE